MDGTKDLTGIERSIHAVRAIRQVLHAIWALSRAQLPLVEHAASAAAIYQQWVDDAAARVAGPPKDIPGRKVLYVAFGPERPFSGPLARRMLDAIPEHGDLGLVGLRLAEAAIQKPSIDARVRFRCVGSVAHDDLHDVAFAVAQQILTFGRGASIVVVHPVEPSRVAHVPLVSARTPTERPAETFGDLGEVAREVIRDTIIGRLAVAAVEALRAEVRARMIAAEAARHACDDRLTELERAWNTRRRETITRELLEAVAGREASLVM